MLGLYSFLGPYVRNFRGLFPSERAEELRLVEEALAGMYTDEVADELDTFRSYFAASPSSAAPFATTGTTDFEMPGEEGEPSPVEASPVRRFSLSGSDAAPPPRVAKLMAPGETGLDAFSEALAENESELPVLSVEDDPVSVDATEAGNGEMDDDLLALFQEAEEVHAVPEAVLRALPKDTDIGELLAEARAVRALLSAGAGALDDVA